MKHANQLHLTLIALLLLTTSTLTKRTMLGSNPGAQRRVLQTAFGGYTMKRELSSTCSDYTEDEIMYTEEEFKEGNDAIKGYFSFLQQPLRDFMKDQNNKQGLEDAGKKNGWILGFNVVFAVFSFFAFIIFIIYFFCMTICSCLCCCCDDELEKDLADKPGDSEMKRAKKARMRRKREKKIKQLNSKTCTACISITSIILVLGITVLGVIWAVYIFNSIGGIKRTDCATSYFFSDVRFGVKDNDLTFVGLGGIKYLFQSLKEDINQLTTPNTIVDQNLDTKADALFPSLKAFYDTYQSKTVASCTGTGTAQPDSIRSLNQNITDFIGKEFTILQDAAKQIHTAAVTANEIAGAAGDGFKASLDEFIKQINDADGNVVKFQTDFTNAINTETNSGYAKLGAWIIMLGTAGLMIFFLLLMACSLNAKCVGCTLFLEALLAILKMFFAFIINTLALVFVVLGVVVVNFCVFSYDAMNDKQLATDLFPKEIKDIFDICLYTDSSGNLLQLVGGESLTNVQGIRDMAEGFAVNLDELNITSLEPPSIKFYRTEMLGKWKTYELSDFQASPADDPQVQVDAGNKIVTCTSDEWQDFKGDCTKSPVSATTDAADKNLATDYCLVPSLWGHTDGATRYPTGNCAAGAATILTNLKKCVDEHDTLISDMDASVIATDGPKERAYAIYQGLQAAKTEFVDLQNKLKKSVEFIASSVESLPSMMNCKIIRKELRNLLGNACYRFTRNFTAQAILLAIIGPLMSVFACCICCTYMKSKVADDLKDLKKAKKKDADNQQRNQQYQQPGHGQAVPQYGGYR